MENFWNTLGLTMGLIMDIFLEIDGRDLTFNELVFLTRCLVMVKTIIMGERQESVVGIANYTFIVQC
jgi:hypothetical protein